VVCGSRNEVGRAPAKDECVSYRTPLFLGGVDDTTNLEICDLDVTKPFIRSEMPADDSGRR